MSFKKILGLLIVVFFTLVFFVSIKTAYAGAGYMCYPDGNLVYFPSGATYTCPSATIDGIFYSGCSNTGTCIKQGYSGECQIWEGACCAQRPEICSGGGASLSCEVGNQINPRNVLNISDNNRYEFGYQIECDSNCGCSDAKVGPTEGNLASPFRTEGDQYRSCISDTDRDCKNFNGWRYSSARIDNLHRIYITKKNQKISQMVKLQRAQGECLGTESRRRT